ncbi:MAG: Alpha-glucosidase [Ilumatobacteraceae bacterium]|nr:Alpha-glucosidase [Ilumatobacteraceae bacterium]
MTDTAFTTEIRTGTAIVTMTQTAAVTVHEIEAGAQRAVVPWWQTAVVYQIYARSFADSNGDGIGDLEGIRSRLDYLQDLGVDAVWLTPCYPSPQRDHGYDVADYFAIEPDYGDLETFDRLVSDARARGIRVMMDVVPNHCSSAHAWFQEALAAAPGSRARARFYFRDGKGEDGSEPPNNWLAWFGGPAWSRVVEPDGAPGQWYLHLFTPWQPDFDWDNDDVAEQFDDMLTFWFDRGVEGFRVDAVSVVGKTPGLPDTPPPPPDARVTDRALHNPHVQFRPEGHAPWLRWRRLTDAYTAAHPDRPVFFVAEAYSPGRPDRVLEYLRGDKFHQVFSFDLLLAQWNAEQFHRAITDSINELASHHVPLVWTLNNHDAQRSVTRYGRDDATDPARFSGNNLINSDSPVDLELGTRRARAAALLMLALPGAAYLYQGEELGLHEHLTIPPEARQDPIFIATDGDEVGRDGCRVPMPWTTGDDGSYGFSPPGAAGAPWLPQPQGWGAWSAEAASVEPTSVLALYREAISMRRELLRDAAEFGFIEAPPGMVGLRNGRLAVFVNFTSETLAVPEGHGDRVVLSSLAGHDGASVLPGNTAIWLA